MESSPAGRLDRLPWFTVPAILLGVPALLWILTLLNPELFYDRIVWKYYWGPIAADAAGYPLTHNGVVAEPGYNTVNTATWALLLGTGILGLAQILNAFKTTMGPRLTIGATAWVVAGSLWHVLEDTNLIAQPLQYFFITPPIYLLFTAFGVLSFLIGQWLVRLERAQGREAGFRQLWLIMIVIVLAYTFAWYKDWGQIRHYVNPLIVAASAALTHLVIRARTAKSGGFDPVDMVLTMSIGWYIVGLAYIYKFQQMPWVNDDGSMPTAIILAPALAGITTWIIARIGAARAKKGSAFGAALTLPINQLLIFSQLIDGFATAIGIDLANYTEKHVLSAWVIDVFREFSVDVGFTMGADYPTFFIFVPIKLLLSLFVVYVIDISSKEDLEKQPTLTGLVKFAIIMVGIGPGVRDFVRLGIGV